MRWKAVVIAAALLVSSVGTAWATDVQLGIKSEAVYDSNLFGRANNPVDDESFRFTPVLDVIQRFPNIDIDLKYQPAYETFINESSINGFDQDVSGSFHWKASERMDVWLSDHFRRYHSLAQFNQQVDLGGGVTSLETFDERNPFNQNFASGSIQYLLSPRQLVQLYGNYTLWNYSQSNRRDFQVISSGLFYQAAVSESLSAGARLSWSRQNFESVGVQPATHTDYYNLSPQLTLKLDPSLEIHLSAGPTLVVSEPPPSPPQSRLVSLYPTANTINGSRLLDVTTCPTLSDGTPVLSGGCNIINTDLTLLNQLFQLNQGVPLQGVFTPVFLTGSVPSPSRESVTVFANMSITKRWDRWTATLQYQRREDTTSGIGVSSIADVASGRLRWRPARRWNAVLAGGWIRRSQAQTLTSPTIGLVVANPPLCSLAGIPPSQALCTSIADAAQSSTLRVAELKNDLVNTTYYAGLRTNYRMTRHITVFGSVWWRQQRNKRNIQSAGTVNRFVARIGLSYKFDPFRF